MHITRTCGQQFNATSFKLGFVFSGAVRAVTLHNGRALDRAAQAALHRHNRIDQWQQLRDIVTVGTRQDGRPWQAVGVGNQMMF
jgi:hypothetical protein